MADEELIDADESGEQLNWPAILVAVVILLGIIGAGVWYFYYREPPTDGPVVEKYEPPGDLVEENVYLDLPELLITPADGRGRSFLILKLDVAMNDPAAVRGQVLTKPWKLAQAKNILIDIYSSLTREQMADPGMKERARQRALEEFNRLIGWTPNPEAEALGEPSLPPIKALYYATYILQ